MVFSVVFSVTFFVRVLFRKAIFALVLLGLAGCDTVDDWIGEELLDEGLPSEDLRGDDRLDEGWREGAQTPAPPSEARIAVQAQNERPQADPELSGEDIILPAPFENKVWTHAGGNPAHAMFHLQLTDQPVERWRRDLGAHNRGDRALLGQPVVVDPVIFAMDAEAVVHAFDRYTGRRYWRRDLRELVADEGGFGGGLAYAKGRLFVTTGFAQIFALNARSGAVQWRYSAPAPLRAAPTVNGGRVFAVTLDNQTLALSAQDGRRLWSHSGVQQEASLLGGASPAVAGRTVVVPYSSGELVALDAVEGEELWSFDLSVRRRANPLTDLSHIRGLPVIDRDRVIAVSHSGQMVALDLAGGRRLWDIDVGGTQTPWVAGDYLYVLSSDAQSNEARVLAVRRSDGRVRWARSLPAFVDGDRDDPLIWYGPVLAGDRLIVAGSQEFLVSLSPYTGDLLGTSEVFDGANLPLIFGLSDGAALPPVVVGGSLYLVSNDAYLIAYQ